MTRTALITGASSGLGLEFAKIFSREGYDLVIIARRENILCKLKKELESRYHNHVEVFACDLSKTDAAFEVFKYTQEKGIRIDALVNNAGFANFGNFWTMDKRRQANLLQVNIVTLVQLTRYFMPGMIDRHYGKILNVASVAAFAAGPKMSLYYASKAFVRSFSEAIAEEAKGTGVTVTALCPGPTATGFEKAAEMKDSNMFKFFKPANAREVAEAGYKALMKKKVLVYFGISSKLMNIGERITPRSISRKFAKKING